jgi:hypothetical protein
MSTGRTGSPAPPPPSSARTRAGDGRRSPGSRARRARARPSAGAASRIWRRNGVPSFEIDSLNAGRPLGLCGGDVGVWEVLAFEEQGLVEVFGESRRRWRWSGAAGMRASSASTGRHWRRRSAGCSHQASKSRTYGRSWKSPHPRGRQRPCTARLSRPTGISRRRRRHRCLDSRWAASSERSRRCGNTGSRFELQPTSRGGHTQKRGHPSRTGHPRTAARRTRT